MLALPPPSQLLSLMKLAFATSSAIQHPSIVSFLLQLNAVMRGSNLLSLLYLVSVLVCNSFLSLPDVIKIQ